MDNEILEKFKKYSPLIGKLNDEIKSNICELIFCMRDNKLSTVIGLKNKHSFLSLVGVIPFEIHNINSNRYFVDLESIGSSDYMRVYVDDADNSKLKYGYYIVNGILLEKKVYKNTSDRYTLNIDRYDNTNNLISENEVEVECTKDDWFGPRGLIEISEKYKLKTNFLKKISKSQCYLRVRQIKS
jgi:hypothetical protein